MARCDQNGFCFPPAYGANGFGATKELRFYKDAIVGDKGAALDNFRFELCDWRFPYVQHWINEFYIQAGTFNQLINYGNLQNKATFVAIKVTWNTNGQPADDSVYLRWSFEQSNDVNPLRSLMILTGTEDAPIKGLKLSNPTNLDAKVEMMIATDNLFMDFNTSTTVATNVAYDDLVIGSIKSISREKISISIVGNDNQMDEVAFLDVDSIENIEVSGRTLIVDDTSVGKIFLGFTDESTTFQALSSLNFITNNREGHFTDYQLPLAQDTQGPQFEFEPDLASGCGELFLDGFDGCINKQNIIDNLLLSIFDDRDGPIYPNTAMLSIFTTQSRLETEEIDKINGVGTYYLRWQARDIANNLTQVDNKLDVIITDDVQGPQIVWTEEFNPANGTALPSAIIYLDNYPVT